MIENAPESAGAASGIVLTVTQTIKALLPSKWYDVALPVTALLLGIIYRTLLGGGEGMPLAEQLVAGIRDGSVAIAAVTIGKNGTKAVSGKK